MTSVIARRPGSRRRCLPGCHIREIPGLVAALAIPQALEEVLQHLVLRRARRAPEDRPRRRDCVLSNAETEKCSTHSTALHLR